MRSRIVAATDESSRTVGDAPNRFRRRARAANSGGVFGRTGNHEVVLHDGFSTDGRTRRDERFFAVRSMGQKNVRVGIAPLGIAPHSQRRTASDRDDLRSNARSLLEDREQIGEQAGIANTRGGHEQQVAFFGGLVGARDHGQRGDQQV